MRPQAPRRCRPISLALGGLVAPRPGAQRPQPRGDPGWQPAQPSRHTCSASCRNRRACRCPTHHMCGSLAAQSRHGRARLPVRRASARASACSACCCGCSHKHRSEPACSGLPALEAPVPLYHNGQPACTVHNSTRPASRQPALPMRDLEAAHAQMLTERRYHVSGMPVAHARTRRAWLQGGSAGGPQRTPGAGAAAPAAGRGCAAGASSAGSARRASAPQPPRSSRRGATAPKRTSCRRAFTALVSRQAL